jgi:hypothetical protein
MHKKNRLELPYERLSPSIKVRWYQTLSPWYLENKFTYPIKIALVENKISFKLLRKIHSFIAGRFIELKRVREVFARSAGRLKSTTLGGNELSSEYGYAGDVFSNELLTAHKYRKQIEEGYPGPSESK